MKKYLVLIISVFLISIAKSQTVYSIDDNTILHTYKFDDTTEPKEPPLWPKGLDSLQEYMDVHLDLSGLELTQYTHRIVIGFKVNKDGSLSDLRFLSSDTSDVAKRVMAMVKNMEGWIPAKYKKGEIVDCYSKMIFTISYGIKKVSYKPD